MLFCKSDLRSSLQNLLNFVFNKKIEVEHRPERDDIVLGGGAHPTTK